MISDYKQNKLKSINNNIIEKNIINKINDKKKEI